MQPPANNNIPSSTKGKFVTTYDGGVTDPVALRKKIAAIKLKVKEQAAELKSIQDEIQWRRADFDHFSQRLSIIKAGFDTHANQLYCKRGIAEQLIGVEEELPSLLRKVKKLELEILLSQKSADKWIALCESQKFRESYAFVREVEKELIKPLDIPRITAIVDKALKAFVECLMPEMADHIADILDHPTTDKINAFIKLIQSIDLKPKIDKTEKIKAKAVSKLSRKALQIASLFAEQKGVDELRILLCRSLAPLPKRCMEWSAVQDAGQGSKQFNFWNKLSVKVKTSYMIGNGYQKTVPYGLRMEKEVGQPLTLLREKFKERVFDFCKGNLDPIPENMIADLQNLKNIFEDYTQDICSLKADEIKPLLFDYLYALEFALEEAQSLCRFAKRCAEESALKIFKAVDDLAKHAKKDENDFSTVLTLYPIQKQWREAIKPPKKEGFELFLRRTLKILRGIHAKRGERILTLKPSEREAMESLLKEKRIDTLYQEGENKKGLPINLIGYLAKRMLHFLFFLGSPHDVELELVLRKLRKNKSLLQFSLNKVEGFADIVNSYEEAYKDFRLDKRVLKSVARIAYHTLLANDILHYARGWIRNSEFARTAEPNNAFQPFFDKWLEQRTPFIIPFKTRDPKSQLEEGMEKIKTLMPDAPTEVRKQHAFESVLFQLLSLRIYAQDLKEQTKAELILKGIFKAEEYQDLLSNLSDPIKTLITQSAFTSKYLTDLERKLLNDGPFNEFFHTPTEQFKKMDVQIFLYKLILQEKADGVLKRQFKEFKRDEFKRWMESFAQIVKD